MKFASIFLLIWSFCSSVSAFKECFSFLLKSNLKFIAVLLLKVWIYGFDTTRFQFTICSSFCPFFTFSGYVTLSLYYKIWRGVKSQMFFRKLIKREAKVEFCSCRKELQSAVF